MWPEKVERDWSMDCSSPISARTASKTGKFRAQGGRHAQTELVHEGEEPYRLERDGLAARVRSCDDECSCLVGNVDIDGYGLFSEQGMPGTPDRESRIAFLDLHQLFPPVLYRPRQARIEMGEKYPGRRDEGSVFPDTLRRLLEDPEYFRSQPGLELDEVVVLLDEGRGFDENRLPRRRNLVDDPLNPAPEVRPHGEDCPPVALGRLVRLEGRPQVGIAPVGVRDRKKIAVRSRYGVPDSLYLGKIAQFPVWRQNIEYYFVYMLKYRGAAQKFGCCVRGPSLGEEGRIEAPFGLFISFLAGLSGKSR